jgi:hypothetical protein
MRICPRERNLRLALLTIACSQYCSSLLYYTKPTINPQFTPGSIGSVAFREKRNKEKMSHAGNLGALAACMPLRWSSL